jgi:hypothetical protein
MAANVYDVLIGERPKNAERLSAENTDYACEDQSLLRREASIWQLHSGGHRGFYDFAVISPRCLTSAFTSGRRESDQRGGRLVQRVLARLYLDRAAPDKNSNTSRLTRSGCSSLTQ